ncbi:MAG: creatininase family protein [Lachnospiraceae bacterium]|jgi:creatinine amidohydrolase|nr:creatininase family protein [Lachnospiraceae bacterium]
MPNKKYWIREMSWVEFDKRRKETKTVIIPSGACEIYGPHLPMGSDSFAAEAVAEEVAKRTNAVIAPMTQVSDSSGLKDFVGTLSMSKGLFEAWMDELVSQLIDYGFENFMFISGHAGSVAPIQSVGTKYLQKNGIRFAQIDWWRFTQQHDAGIFTHQGRMCHAHASECGTSVMLHLRPDLVDMDQAVCVPPAENEFPDILTFAPMHTKTPNATVGDATAGTAKKGEKIYQLCVDRIVTYMEKMWG